jgi:hypothetical protein
MSDKPNPIQLDEDYLARIFKTMLVQMKCIKHLVDKPELLEDTGLTLSAEQDMLDDLLVDFNEVVGSYKSMKIPEQTTVTK